jgi:hypothetical protein
MHKCVMEGGRKRSATPQLYRERVARFWRWRRSKSPNVSRDTIFIERRVRLLRRGMKRASDCYKEPL